MEIQELCYLQELCYPLVFVYNSTEPEKKLEFPTEPTDYSALKYISDFTINRIVVNDIPENYLDLWNTTKFQYLTWGRDQLIKLNKEKGNK